MASDSFGLQPENQIEIHKLILDMVMFSKGGITHTEAYNMPVHLRSFYYKRMVEIFEKSKEDADKVTTPPNKRPEIPDSVRKAIGKAKPKKGDK